jgi:hypothetical protein
VVDLSSRSTQPLLAAGLSPSHWRTFVLSAQQEGELSHADTSLVA